MTKTLLALATFAFLVLPAAAQTGSHQAAALGDGTAIVGAWCDSSRRDGSKVQLTIFSATATSFTGEHAWRGTGPYTNKVKGQIVGGTTLQYAPHTNVRYELVNKGDKLEGTGTNLGRANSHWFVTFKKGAC